jgi:hypothetical protein
MGIDFVEDPDEPGDLYLAHPDFEDADTADQVRRVARDVVSDLRAAVGVTHPSGPSIEFRDIIRRMNDDGTLGPRAIYMTLEDTVFTMMAHATGSTARRHPSRRALDLMQRDDNFREAARIYAECGEDIPRLYVVFEHICDAAAGRRVRGSTNQLERRGWATTAAIQRFRMVANEQHRHRKRPARETMHSREARSFIGALLAAWLNFDMPS